MTIRSPRCETPHRNCAVSVREHLTLRASDLAEPGRMAHAGLSFAETLPSVLVPVVSCRCGCMQCHTDSRHPEDGDRARSRAAGIFPPTRDFVPSDTTFPSHNAPRLAADLSRWPAGMTALLLLDSLSFPA